MGTVIDGIPGDKKLADLKEIGWEHSHKYAGKKFDDLPGHDQLAISEAYGKLVFPDTKEVAGSAPTEPVTETEFGPVSKAFPESGNDQSPEPEGVPKHVKHDKHKRR